MLTCRILEDYTDDAYQLSLASRKGRYYICNVEQRKNWKKYARCGPFQFIIRIMPIARRRKSQPSQPSMHYETRWKKAACAIRCWKNWTLMRLTSVGTCAMIFCVFAILWIFIVCNHESDNLRNKWKAKGANFETNKKALLPCQKGR